MVREGGESRAGWLRNENGGLFRPVHTSNGVSI